MAGRNGHAVLLGNPFTRIERMVEILIAILLAAVAYWVCLAVGLPLIIGVVAALIVLLVGVSGRRL